MSDSQQLTRVLVTGGSGFLGAHVVEQLLSDPTISVAIVSRKPQASDHSTRLHIHPADIASEAQVQAVFDTFKPQAVIHTASPHHTETTATFLRTNVEGTKVLLRCAKTCSDTRAFVYTSSDSAVEPTQEPLTEENAKLYNEKHHVNPYGMSKAIADAAVQSANDDDLRTAVIRLPGIYGEKDTNFIPQLVSGVRKKEHKMQIGQNKKVFEFVYVAKAAEAHILAVRALMDPKTAAGVAGEAFFISDGRPEPFFDFARRCYAAIGSPVAPKEVTVIPMPVMQVMASAGEWAYRIFTLGTKMPNLRRDGIDHLDKGCCWSIEKAKQRLGYRPVADQDTAIKRSMEWGVANT
ncbi:NAD(P)-binding protein [Byssothecium circinans]|uniref:NAD(P)-binding protein n=1 Tax=Byssothecium circinans TaxID=147558 RepID=A0A6A5TUL4_9PLEO|nr:NAD(P)-binding protein [Byssothecium circinans]